MMNKAKKSLIFGMAILLMPIISGAIQPKFSLTPTTPTTLHLSSTGSVIVQYQVTNNTKLTRTLTMAPTPGISQVTSGSSGLCANPFTLTPSQSCFLRLEIQASQLVNPTLGGPVVCKTYGDGNNNPTPFLCSQPSQPNSLNISVNTEPSASISLIAGSPLELRTRGSSGTMTIRNNSSTSFAQNITANFTGTALEGKVTVSTVQAQLQGLIVY